MYFVGMFFDCAGMFIIKNVPSNRHLW